MDLQINSIEGKLLIEKQNTKDIDISKLPTGVYILNVYEMNSGLRLKTERVVRLGN